VKNLVEERRSKPGPGVQKTGRGGLASNRNEAESQNRKEGGEGGGGGGEERRNE